MNGNRKSALLALSSIPLIMTLGNSMLIPVLPEIRRQLQITPLQTSLLITVFSVMAILLIPIAGYLSDRIGRKKVIVPSLIVAGIGGGICAAAAIWVEGEHAYVYILIGRILQGIGAAGAAPIVMPLVGDLFKSEKKVSAGLGLIETSNTFGKVLSPIIGSLLAWIAWYYPFVSIPVFSAISVLLVLWLVPSPKRVAEPIPFKEFLHSLGSLFRKKGRWLYVLFALGGVGMFMLFAFLIYLSDILEDKFHMKGIMKGAVLAIPLAILCSASYVTGKIIGENKRRMKLLTTAGFLLATAASAACIWFDGVMGQIVFLSTAGLGIGVALPCLDAFITEGIEKERRGTVSSFYSSLRFAGVAIGPPAASLLTGRTADPLFWTLAAVGIVSAALAWFFIRPGKAAAERKKERRPSSFHKPKLIRPPS